MIRYITSIVFLISVLFTKAQSSADILEKYAHFNSFKTVLYMAAHPDDENTRVISWLVNGEHAKTGYLSLTRGDGGQNLIGEELGDELGILRTQELLAARSIDGGEQFFTRAVDFGYSRSATETLDKWSEEEVLADVVWVIRKFKPQIIITRFPPDERAGHGHHTASAMLAIKGAEAAADPTRFPEQLEHVTVWKVQSVYWNTSTWWDKTVEAEMDTNNAIWRADIGGYNPNLGVSFNELGSLARSQHKCQGFGVDIQRGQTFEYFRHLWGEELPNGLESLAIPSWSQMGSSILKPALKRLNKNFSLENREETLKLLAEVYNALGTIEDDYWRQRKQQECAELILAMGGFFAEALANDFAFLQGSTISVEVNLLSRTTDKFTIDGLQAPGGQVTFKAPYQLPLNQFANFKIDIALTEDVHNPYWLMKPHGNLYAVKDPVRSLGSPQNEPIASVQTAASIFGASIPLSIPVRYKWRDRVEGELQRDVVTVPALCINFEQPMYVSLNGDTVEVKARLKWFQKDKPLKVAFACAGWKVAVDGYANEDGFITLETDNLQKEEILTIRLVPSGIETAGNLTAKLASGEPIHSYHEIAYDHIPTQVYMPVSSASITNLKVAKKGERVAYINGAGDLVADAIRQMGYMVDVLGEDELANNDLSVYQAIVVGIRAYNTQEWLQGYTDKILAYINAGGNYIVQYNTASRFLNDAPLIPSPYPFNVGRGRVTEEDAPVTFLLPSHPVLNSPNKLTKADFDNWVQERGLYFASDWDTAFAAPIGWNDTGESQEKGGLIIAPYGSGAFIYTGISFFRILPAGVEGGYRLLANLISYEAE